MSNLTSEVERLRPTIDRLMVELGAMTDKASKLQKQITEQGKLVKAQGEYIKWLELGADTHEEFQARIAELSEEVEA